MDSFFFFKIIVSVAMKKLYSIKIIFRTLAIMAILVVGIHVTQGYFYPIVLLPTLFALLMKKCESLFFWLFISICLMVSNSTVVTKGVVFVATIRALMVLVGCILAVQMISQRKAWIIRPLLLILPFLLFEIFPSMTGWDPPISFMKLFLFTSIYLGFFSLANLVTVDGGVRAEVIRSYMLAFAIYFIWGSIVLLPFPALSQLRGEDAILYGTTSLLKGMTFHPQCLGPLVSSFAVLLLGDMLFSIKRFDWIYGLVLLPIPYLVYRTSSRTGMGAFIFGVLFVLFLFIRAKGIYRQWRGKVIFVFSLLGLVMTIVVISMPSIQQQIAEFVLKWNTEQPQGIANISYEGLVSSRQSLIDASIHNFKSKPLCGNGFQVMEYMTSVKRTSLIAYLTAPVEKGVWITAILEEGGIIGFILFAWFVIYVFIASIVRKAYLGVGLFGMMLLGNLGEFTMLSMSSTGGVIWAMIFVGYAFDARRLKEEQMCGVCTGVSQWV